MMALHRFSICAQQLQIERAWPSGRFLRSPEHVLGRTGHMAKRCHGMIFRRYRAVENDPQRLHLDFAQPCFRLFLTNRVFEQIADILGIWLPGLLFRHACTLIRVRPIKRPGIPNLQSTEFESFGFRGASSCRFEAASTRICFT